MGLFDDLIPEQQNNQKKLSDGPLSRLIGGAVAFGQGGMPIFDEAGAFLGEKLGTGGDISYEDRLANIRNLEKSFSAENPKTDLALRVGGAIGATVPLAGAIAARPITSGAAYGALQGFTGSEGGGDSRAFGGALGAGLGAGGAVVADKLLAPAAVWAGQKMGFVKPPAMSLKAKELETIKNNLSLGGITPQQYAANLLRSTPDDFAGELGGEALRLQTQANANVMGPSLASTREAMRQRLAQAPQRVGGIIDEALGSADETAALLARVDEMKAAEDGLYYAAQGSIPTRDVAELLNRPAGQQAIKDASTNLANRYGQGLDETFVSGKAMPLDLTIKQAHEISKSLGGQIQKNPLTGAMVDPAQGGPISGLQKGIIDRLRQASPEFDAAQTTAAQIRQAEEKLSLGRKIARMSSGETADDALIAALKKEDVTPYTKAGFRQGLQDIAKDIPLGTGNPAAGLARQKTVDRIAEIAGPENAEQFGKKILAEKLRMDLANKALNQSTTAGNVSAGLSDVPLSKVAATSKIINSIDDFVNAKSRERLNSALLSRTPEEKMELARLLTGPDAASLIPSLGKRNEILEIIRGSLPALPAQAGAAVINAPNGGNY